MIIRQARILVNLKYSSERISIKTLIFSESDSACRSQSIKTHFTTYNLTLNRMTTKVVLWALIFQLVSPLMLLSTSPTTGYLHRFCTKDNYRVNSPFARNLKKLLQSLPTASLTGFNQTEVKPDVFGQGLCRGDTSPPECRSCLQKATEEILIQCHTKEAIIWFNLCQVHYSSTPFFSSMTYTGKYPSYNTQMERTYLPAKFRVVLSELFNKLSNEAAYNSSRKRFAAGRAEVSGKMIYALVQCTTDISPEDSHSCLNQALGDLKGCCFPHQGGMVLSRTCDVRFGLKSFYNASAIDEIFLSRDGGNKTKEALMVVGSVVAVLIAIILTFLFYRRKRKQAHEDEEKNRTAVACAFSIPKGVAMTEEGSLVCTDELPFMELATIKAATANFSDSNKLGQGGFGSIYRGSLPDGKEVAVKRLSSMSWQGFEEFKNEIILIAKLQHINLVRLLGCGLQGQEQILVYEFMPNRSLDLYIFDPEKRAKMNWNTRYNIINGIAKGLLYLHQDSRLRIIHRDLKPSNILLDDEMVAKISDFGMARIFKEDENTVISTRRVVGSYGYMAPEYAMEGLFSVKSDVFSFGVILLEIISGKKNRGFHLTVQAQTLLAYAWRLWNEEKVMEFVDSLLPDQYQKEEVKKCIQIGLLCVQEDPADRPTMSSVVSLLGNGSPILPTPNRPAVPVGKLVNHHNISSTESCLNDFSEYSIISPR